MKKLILGIVVLMLMAGSVMASVTSWVGIVKRTNDNECPQLIHFTNVNNTYAGTMPIGWSNNVYWLDGRYPLSGTMNAGNQRATNWDDIVINQDLNVGDKARVFQLEVGQGAAYLNSPGALAAGHFAEALAPNSYAFSGPQTNASLTSAYKEGAFAWGMGSIASGSNSLAFGRYPFVNHHYSMVFSLGDTVFRSTNEKSISFYAPGGLSISNDVRIYGNIYIPGASMYIGGQHLGTNEMDDWDDAVIDSTSWTASPVYSTSISDTDSWSQAVVDGNSWTDSPSFNISVADTDLWTSASIPATLQSVVNAGRTYTNGGILSTNGGFKVQLVDQTLIGSIPGFHLNDPSGDAYIQMTVDVPFLGTLEDSSGILVINDSNGSARVSLQAAHAGSDYSYIKDPISFGESATMPQADLHVFGDVRIDTNLEVRGTASIIDSGSYMLDFYDSSGGTQLGYVASFPGGAVFELKDDDGTETQTYFADKSLNSYHLGFFGVNVGVPSGTEKFRVDGDAIIDSNLTVGVAGNGTEALLTINGPGGIWKADRGLRFNNHQFAIIDQVGETGGGYGADASSIGITAGRSWTYPSYAFTNVPSTGPMIWIMGTNGSGGMTSFASNYYGGIIYSAMENKLGDGGAHMFEVGGLPDGTATRAMTIKGGGDVDVAFNLDVAGTISGMKLNDLEDPDGDKTFAMGNNKLTWQFNNSAAAMVFEVKGGYSGDMIDIDQSTGNPGSSHLVHIDADDDDCKPLHLEHSGNPDYMMEMVNAAPVIEFDDSDDHTNLFIKADAGSLSIGDDSTGSTVYWAEFDGVDNTLKVDGSGITNLNLAVLQTTVVSYVDIVSSSVDGWGTNATATFNVPYDSRVEMSWFSIKEFDGGGGPPPEEVIHFNVDDAVIHEQSNSIVVGYIPMTYRFVTNFSAGTYQFDYSTKAVSPTPKSNVYCSTIWQIKLVD